MNNKIATLGLGAAVVGVLTALVGAALAGKSVAPRSAGEGGTDQGAPSSNAAAAEAEPASASQATEPPSMQWPTPAADTATGPATADLLPPAGAPRPETALDGPSGPTAHPQPALTGDEGHAAPDLASNEALGPDHRAPVAFRPDMDAPMTAAEREALRPATGPSPSLVSDEGAGVQGPGGSLA